MTCKQHFRFQIQIKGNSNKTERYKVKRNVWTVLFVSLDPPLRTFSNCDIQDDPNLRPCSACENNGLLKGGCAVFPRYVPASVRFSKSTVTD